MTTKMKVDYEALYNSVISNPQAEIISYGISDNYVPLWTEKESLTEYIANFYDENKTNFSIKTIGSKAVLLEDESERGIKLEDLAFGNSNSREYTYKIGTHGEGFKLGALVLSRLGKKVLIETIGYTIAFYLDFESDLNSNVLKTKVIPNNRKKGSSVYLETNLVEDVQNRFLFLNDNLETENGFLYTPKETNKPNYIFVNTLGSQEIKSVFSYSIHKKQKVNRDRNMLESPYHDIAVELFNSNNKELLQQWFRELPQDIHNYFEYEIIKYYMENRKRAIFKHTDISVIEEAAKELPLFYYRYDDIQEYVYANPKVIFVSSENQYIEKFFTDVAKCSAYNYSKTYELNASLKIRDKYSFLITKNSLSPDYLITHLFDNLELVKILKEAEFNDDKLIVELKPKSQVDLEKGIVIRGKTRDKRLSKVIGYLAQLLHKKYISINDWDYSIREYNGNLYFEIKDIPKTFIINIHHQDILSVVENNITFMKKKVIIKDSVYQLPDKQYEISNTGDLVREINSEFSYHQSCLNNSYDISSLLKSAKYMKFVFDNLKTPEKISFELDIIERFINITNQSRYSYISYQQDISTNLSKLFVQHFGLNSCVSTNKEKNDLAKYNRYTVVNLPTQLERLFHLLEIHLSSQVKGVAKIDYDVIERPNEVSWETYSNNPYLKLIKSCLILEEILKDVFIQTNQHYRPYDSQIKKLLPSRSSLNDTEINVVNFNRATKTNYHKVIRHYAFIIFNKSHIVSSFDKETTNGLCNGKMIFVKERNKGFLGTFLHEYIHLSTGLHDIDSEFEKMLSFVSVLGFKHKDVINEENIKTFIKEYETFSRG